MPEPTTRRALDFLPWTGIGPLYTAVVEATEEAVLNALAAGRTMTGHDGHRSPGLPWSALGTVGGQVVTGTGRAG